MSNKMKWSPDDIRVLRKLHKVGYGASIIAKNLNRSKLSVMCKIIQIF